MFEGDQSGIGWGLEAIAAYVYTHIMKAATYSVCIRLYYLHIIFISSQISVAFISASYLT